DIENPDLKDMIDEVCKTHPFAVRKMKSNGYIWLDRTAASECEWCLDHEDQTKKRVHDSDHTHYIQVSSVGRVYLVCNHGRETLGWANASKFLGYIDTMAKIAPSVTPPVSKEVIESMMTYDLTPLPKPDHLESILAQMGPAIESKHERQPQIQIPIEDYEKFKRIALTLAMG